jgi:hypothetical protein
MDKLRTIQVKPLDVKCSGLRQALADTVDVLDQMRDEVISERMQYSAGRVQFPVVALELVAGVARINPVTRLVRTTARLGLKVIDRQFRADIAFPDAAIPTAKAIKLAKRQSFVGSHPVLASVGEDQLQLSFNRPTLRPRVEEGGLQPLRECSAANRECLKRSIPSIDLLAL